MLDLLFSFLELSGTRRRRNCRPWWGLAALAAALVALIIWAAGPHLASALSPAPTSNPAAASNPASPSGSPGLSFSFDLQRDPPEAGTTTPPTESADASEPSEAPDTDQAKPRLRDRLGTMWSTAKDKGASLIRDDEPTVDNPPEATPADAASGWKDRIGARLTGLKKLARRDTGGPGEASSSTGGWTLTFGSPSTSSFSRKAAAPHQRIESSLVLAALIFSALALVLAAVSEVLREPRWVGMAAAATGGLVILAYVLALIATVLMGLVALLVLSAILSALAGAAPA